MAKKIKSQIIELFEGHGILDSGDLDSIILQSDDESIDITKILRQSNGRYVKVSIIATNEKDVPLVESN